MHVLLTPDCKSTAASIALQRKEKIVLFSKHEGAPKAAAQS